MFIFKRDTTSAQSKKIKCLNIKQKITNLLLLLGMGCGAEVVPGVTFVVVAWSSLVDRLRGIVKTLNSRGLC